MPVFVNILINTAILVLSETTCVESEQLLMWQQLHGEEYI